MLVPPWLFKVVTRVSKLPSRRSWEMKEILESSISACIGLGIVSDSHKEGSLGGRRI
jgi:hypothetical protein